MMQLNWSLIKGKGHTQTQSVFFMMHFWNLIRVKNFYFNNFSLSLFVLLSNSQDTSFDKSVTWKAQVYSSIFFFFLFTWLF